MNIRKKFPLATASGSFKTTVLIDVKFTMPEFSSSKEIKLSFSVIKNNSGIPYNMIIGTQLLYTLGIILNFKDSYVKWNNRV